MQGPQAPQPSQAQQPQQDPKSTQSSQVEEKEDVVVLSKKVEKPSKRFGVTRVIFKKNGI